MTITGIQHPIEIDGADIGGQLMRTALSLSLATGRSFQMKSIRAGRPRPGLARKHLAAIRAAACSRPATVIGAELGSSSLHFQPGALPLQASGPRAIDCFIGLAGGTPLVALMLIPGLLKQKVPTTITLEGITHYANSPSYEFLEQTYLPVLRQIGFSAAIHLDRPGFSPVGGGRIQVTIDPAGSAVPVHLRTRGNANIVSATSYLCGGLATDIARRELKGIQSELGLQDDQLHIRGWKECISPGNVLTVQVELGDHTECFTEIGEFGKTAEKVAHNIARQVRLLCHSQATVSHFLAEHLLVPMALVGGGSLVTPVLTAHIRQTLTLLPQFLPIMFRTETFDDQSVLIELQPA